MENGTWSNDISKYTVFQGRQKVLSWSKGSIFIKCCMVEISIRINWASSQENLSSGFP